MAAQPCWEFCLSAQKKLEIFFGGTDKKVVSLCKVGAAFTHEGSSHLKQGLCQDSTPSLWAQEVELEQWGKVIAVMQVRACKGSSK